ncbi:hypothetical protein AAZX31_10G052900 [Glycine max]
MASILIMEDLKVCLYAQCYYCYFTGFPLTGVPQYLFCNKYLRPLPLSLSKKEEQHYHLESAFIQIPLMPCISLINKRCQHFQFQGIILVNMEVKLSHTLREVKVMDVMIF